MIHLSVHLLYLNFYSFAKYREVSIKPCVIVWYIRTPMVFPNHNNSSILLGSPLNQDSFYRDLSTGNSPPLAASRFQPATVSPQFPLVQIPLVPFPEVVPNSQVPVVPQLRGCEYSITSNPHPYQGEEIFNSTPQVGNQSIGSQNS